MDGISRLVCGRVMFLSLAGAILWLSLSLPLAAQSPTTVSALERTEAAPSSYVLSVNDVVEIQVFQEDELKAVAKVSKDGTIPFPLLGTVRLSGLNVQQATAKITELLKKDFLVNPQVSLTVAQFSKKRFTVLGQVGRPGSFDMPDQESLGLLEAIGMAGGYTRISDPKKITIRRIVGGSEKVFRVNAKEMANGGGTHEFAILPGDTITVGESIF